MSRQEFLNAYTQFLADAIMFNVQWRDYYDLLALAMEYEHDNWGHR